MKSLLIIFISLFALNLHAGVHIEPYLGYASLSEDGNNFSDEDVTGMLYGLRLGYAAPLGLSFGAEYMTGSLEDETSPKIDFTPASLGFFVAYELPVMFRFYGTYFFDDIWELAIAGSSLDYEGSGMKLGVGYTGLPFVAINVEYYTVDFDETDSGGKLDAQLSGIGFNVSLPFNL